uniref:Uncharacterized protein n=1 Tax=Solanum lycopersicum TaxID=4081 RepID=A0A3Q7FM35_SOLLC
MSAYSVTAEIIGVSFFKILELVFSVSSLCLPGEEKVLSFSYRFQNLGLLLTTLLVGFGGVS